MLVNLLLQWSVVTIRPFHGPHVHPSDNDYIIMQYSWQEEDRENVKQSQKTHSVFVCPLEIPNELPYYLTRFSVVRSW